MSYKALYRKYRPLKFDEVFGQEVIIRTLKNSIKNNKISHAYLFSGPRGIGKTSIARIFAKTLNCKNAVNQECCCECQLCQEVQSSTSPDVIEIDAASNNGVDEIRDIRDKVKFLPVGAKYKIYIIDEVHMLSQGAFNALLKTLEEPPKHAIFILATTEMHKIPATIISRCQCFEFKGLSVDEISENLKGICEKENINITLEAIKQIAIYAEGGMRDALSCLDQAISYNDGLIDIDIINNITGSVNVDSILSIISSLENKDVTKAIAICDKLTSEGKDASKIINSMLEVYKDILIYKNVNQTSSKLIYEHDTFKTLVDKISDNSIFYYVDILTDVSQKIKFLSNPQVMLEVSLVRITNANSDILRLSKRIEEFEERLNNFEVPQTQASQAQPTRDSLVVEEKINKVVMQLNKLNLPEVISRVNELESKFDKLSANKTSDELAKIQEDILILKTQSLSGNDSSSEASEDYSEIASRIEKLEQLSKQPSTSLDSVVLSNCVNKIEVLSKEINTIASKEPSVIEYHDESKINDCVNKINEIEGKLQEYAKLEDVSVNTVSNINQNEIESNVRKYVDEVYSNLNIESQLAQLEQKIERVGSNLNQESLHILEQRIGEIESIKRSILSNNRSGGSDYDLTEIKNKIVNIENKLHKYIAYVTSDDNAVVKKTKTTKSGVGYYSEGLFSIDEFNNAKVNVDFEDLAQEAKPIEPDPQISVIEDVKVPEIKLDEESVNEPEVVLDNAIEVKEVEAETVKVEETLVEEQTPQVEVSKKVYDQISLFDELVQESTVKDVEEVKHQEDSNVDEEINKKFESFEKPKTLEMEKTSFDIEKPKTLEQLDNELSEQSKTSSSIERQKEIDLFNHLSNNSKPKDEVISKVEKEDGTLITKTNSQLYKRNSETNIYDIFAQERTNVAEKMKEVKPIEEVKPSRVDQFDEYKNFDIKIVERILNESRTEEAKADKARVLKVWNILDNNIDYSDSSIAEMLKEGEVKAVGKKEFIITYSNTMKCNQVMREKFLHQASKFLYDKLGDSYKYLALPVSVWEAKREEYVSQYYTGSRFPKLTPIDDNILSQLKEFKEYEDKDQKTIDSIQEIFGSSRVTVK